MAALGPEATPVRVTTALAAAKAEAVIDTLDAAVAADCVVIGCDSMLYLGDELRGKPATPDAALLGWREMAGKPGHLYTGHCLIRLRGGVVVHQSSESSSTTVHFGTPSDAELDAYVHSGEPTAVAGGFTLDGLGGWFIEGVDGDPSAVIGIGLPLIRRLLHDAGLSLVDLWSTNSST